MEIGTCEITAEEVIHALETRKTHVLATCAENRVTIRPMSHINDGLTVFFQTNRNSLKMSQIRANPLVALYVGTYEIEGAASELGRPLADENAFFAQEYRKRHPRAFERYSSTEDEIVVRITVKRVRQWRYIDGKALLADSTF